MAVCRQEQVRDLLNMHVLFGPCRISVDDVDESYSLRGRVLLVTEIAEADIDKICSWVDSFESMTEDGVIVNVEEVSFADLATEIDRMMSPIVLSRKDIGKLFWRFREMDVNKYYITMNKYFPPNKLLYSRTLLDAFIKYISEDGEEEQCK